MNDRITLTMQDILEKEFKIDARGYRPQEVDKFLDIIIKATISNDLLWSRSKSTNSYEGSYKDYKVWCDGSSVHVGSNRFDCYDLYNLVKKQIYNKALEDLQKT